MASCDRTKQNRPTPTYGDPADFSPVDHDYVHAGDEYGSLSDGGSYEIYDCKVCGRRAFSAMAD